MTTTTKQARKSTRKPEPRHLNISKPVNGNYALSLTIGEGEKAKRFCYFLEPIAADFGLAFRFVKFTNEVEEGEPAEYAVNIDLQHGHHSCECKGFMRWNHCKHVESLLALVNAGKIGAPASNPARVVSDTCFNCDKPYSECTCTI